MKTKLFGDFQTPLPLVKEILTYLHSEGIEWTRVLEPTCGIGNFISGLLEDDNPPREIIGIELQPDYAQVVNQFFQKQQSQNTLLTILNTSIFSLNLSKDIIWENDGPLLVIGNPPWVTNSALSIFNSDNLPQKSNFKKFKGIEAITGHSNFDIAEFIWIKLITELSSNNSTNMSLLCKTSVARNVLSFANQISLPINNAKIRKLDTKKWFGVQVDACLFTLKIDHLSRSYTAKIFPVEYDSHNFQQIGFVGKHLISDLRIYQHLSFIEGANHLECRQGLKHDAALVMELIEHDNKWYNQLGEWVDIEENHLFPLIKSSDILNKQLNPIKRAVIVTQRQLGEDTRHLQCSAPKLWDYLSSHKEFFDRRKSAIYKGKPAFSMFGIGNYSFKPYKVLISGFSKEIHFFAAGLQNGKPVMCDDTVYMFPLETAPQALIVCSILNHEITKQFIESIIFWDNKRPVTKSILSRINIQAIINHISINEFTEELEDAKHNFLGSCDVDANVMSLEVVKSLMEKIKKGQLSG